MKGVDTNVVVRFLTRDDEGQFTKAVALISQETPLSLFPPKPPT